MLYEQNEGKFRTLYQNIPEGLLLTVTDGNILSANPEACKMFQMTEDEICKLGRFGLVDPSDLRLKPLLEERALNKYARGEINLKRKDGTIFPAIVTSVAFIDEGNEYRTLLMVKDMSEVRKAENDVLVSSKALQNLNEELERQAIELRRSNLELEQFAYIASHDLQEPLRMVKSFMELLQRKYHDKLDSQATKYINFAVDGATRMEQLIKDLLNYSVSIDEKDNELADVITIVEDVIANLSHAIQESAAVIKYDSLPQLYLPRIYMGQLFQNLISNALKYQSEGNTPYILLSADEKDDHWEFSIQDNGIGISEKYSENIFTIFKRLHGKNEYSGTGIGLAICKKIIQKLNGKIWVKSLEGSGSTFYFTIPNHPF